MSETHESTQAQGGAGRYEIRIMGHLDARWAEWFDGLSFAHERDGTTVLAGTMVDQAALYGVLRKVRDLGLPLLAVARVEPRCLDGSDGTVDSDDNRTKETDR
jgi:hypothetical protein